MRERDWLGTQAISYPTRTPINLCVGMSFSLLLRKRTILVPLWMHALSASAWKSLVLVEQDSFNGDTGLMGLERAYPSARKPPQLRSTSR